MPKYNPSFDLSVEDLDLIETALHQKIELLSSNRIKYMASDNPDKEEIARIGNRIAEIHDLLGRLHNQKTFYRPNAKGRDTYVSG